MKKIPLVSIIIPTRNSERLLESCLKSIKKQTYKNIEIIISDGLSTDKTLEIARKYKSRILKNKEILAEPGISLGIKNATGDLLMVIAIDNEFKEKDAIKTIVKVFENKKIFAVFPKHNSSKKDNLFSRYINTFTDPFNHFVYGYAANARTFKKIYKTIEHNKIYDIYDFKSKDILPILALAQGFSIRKDFIKRKRNEMDDIAPVIELIKDRKLIAYVHSINLYHHTISNVNHFIRKQRWAAKNALEKTSYGIHLRAKTLTSVQKIKMYIFPIYSLTIVTPVLCAAYFLLKDREKMWLFHPFIAFISGASIIFEYAKIKLRLSRKISRL